MARPFRTAKNPVEGGHRVLVLEREPHFKDRVLGKQMHPGSIGGAQAMESMIISLPVDAARLTTVEKREYVPRTRQPDSGRQWIQMRKRIVDKRPPIATAEPNAGWRDLTQIATVEVTSEDLRFPIESVFTGGPGWRAGETGNSRSA
jgi:hypothetical protein